MPDFFNDVFSAAFGSNTFTNPLLNNGKTPKTTIPPEVQKILSKVPDFSRYDADAMKWLEREKVRYGWSYVDFDKMMDKFNISRFPDYENAPEPYIGYILMSRPVLNVAATSNTVSPSAYQNLQQLRNIPMTSAFVNDSYGYKMLMSLAAFSNNVWMPVITTKAKTYTVNDFDLKTIDKGNTYYGHMIKYGKHSEEHKVAGTISIDFRNDRYLSILKMMYIWMCYIYLVSKTDLIVPSMANQINGILDYASSIYFLVTRRDGRELVYWEKLTGVFPTRSPLSIFSYSDEMIIQDNISIEFSYGIRSDPCDPAILMDINTLSGTTLAGIQNKTTGYVKLTNETSLRNGESGLVKGDIWATNPFIRVSKTSTGHLRYFLDWENRSTSGDADGMMQNQGYFSRNLNYDPEYGPMRRG